MIYLFLHMNLLHCFCVLFLFNTIKLSSSYWIKYHIYTCRQVTSQKETCWSFGPDALKQVFKRWFHCETCIRWRPADCGGHSLWLHHLIVYTASLSPVFDGINIILTSPSALKRFIAVLLLMMSKSLETTVGPKCQKVAPKTAEPLHPLTVGSITPNTLVSCVCAKEAGCRTVFVYFCVHFLMHLCEGAWTLSQLFIKHSQRTPTWKKHDATMTQCKHMLESYNRSSFK